MNHADLPKGWLTADAFVPLATPHLHLYEQLHDMATRGRGDMKKSHPLMRRQARAAVLLRRQQDSRGLMVARNRKVLEGAASGGFPPG